MFRLIFKAVSEQTPTRASPEGGRSTGARTAASALAAAACALLGGCGSVTGFSNANTDFGCADVSGAPSCRNISAVYEENNPTSSFSASDDPVSPRFDTGLTEVAKNSEASARVSSSAPVKGTEALQRDVSSSDVSSSGVSSSGVSSNGLSSSAVPSSNAASREAAFVTIIAQKPWRKPETVLRVWLAPFTDKEGDLHDQRYLYVRLNNGGWTKETVEELAKPSRAFTPVYPLADEKEPTADEIKRENLKKLPAFGFGSSPLPAL